MNYHDYASVSTQATTPTATPTSATNNHSYYYPLSNTTPLDTTTNGYIITHQHTPSVVTYSTDTANTTDTTTIIDTSSYSFSTSANDQQHSYQHAHGNGYPLYQQQQQQQQQEEDGTLALNHIQMASSWQNQTNSAAPMIPTTDPHFTTLNNDEELLVPFPERGVAGFVCKLYQSLEAPDGGEKYAHWCHHNGKDMFIIDCIPKFTETVLPKLFKHCKFASFVRQLNIYGFQRDTDARKSKDSKDKEICRWYHTHFRPGRRDLFHLIRRKAPRYSRRKRIKTEQDEEKTSLHSGDDSDQDNGNATLQQSSPNTSVATTPTMKNMNTVMMYSSPTSMVKNEDDSADSSPMMVSPPPPRSSSSATVAASDFPSPQQQQSSDHPSVTVLSMQSHHQQQQQQQQQLGNPSSALLLTHQSHPFQHQNQRDIQQDSNNNIQHQQDMCTNYQQPQHDTPTSLCLTSPLGMDTALAHAGSAHFIEEPPHPSFQSHQLQQQQQTSAILHQPQQHLQRASSSSSSSDPLQQQSHHHFQQMQQLQTSHQQHQQQLLSIDQDPNMYHMMFQTPVSSSTPTSPSIFYQEELKAHITRLQHEYEQMHTYFTNELGKAREQIKTQRLRSEFLERSLRGEQ